MARSLVQAKKRNLGLLEDDEADITDLAEQVSAKEKEFGVKIPVITNTPERAFYKELAKVIKASYVILEVLDTRDPIGTLCLDIEKMVLKAGPEKHLILLLNKIDLVPREAAEKWLNYLREELPTVAFKCSTQKQKSNLGWKSAKVAKKTTKILQTSECIGAETLKLLKNYSRSHEASQQVAKPHYDVKVQPGTLICKEFGNMYTDSVLLLTQTLILAHNYRLTERNRTSDRLQVLANATEL